MADWGLLSGLGAGLQQFGNTWTSNAKAELAEKLAQQREDRAEARQIAREERQAQRLENTVASWKPVIGDEGVTYMQGFNAAGAPKGERRLANQQEIADFNRQQETNRLSLEELTSKVNTAKFKEGRLEQEAALDDEYSRARIAAQNASASASRSLANSRDSKSAGEDKTERDYVDYVLTNGKAIVSQYTGTQANPGVLTASEVDDIATRAARLGVAEQRDPIAIFKRMLEDAAAMKKPTKIKEGERAIPRFMGDY